MFINKKIRIPFWLAFSGVLLMSGCQDKVLITEKNFLGTPTVRLGDTEVANVDGTKIYLSDIEHMALAQGLIKTGDPITPKDPVFHRVLDELIDQRLLALEALKRSYDREDEAGRRLALAREKILSNIVVEKLIAAQITQESVKRMYEEQKTLGENSTQVRARQIIVETEKLALELKDLAEKGGDFSVLAKEFSLDNSTRDLGGDLRYFSQNAMAPEISDVAFTTEKGAVSDPFETEAGWHILMVVDKRKTPQPRFEDIQSEIISFMTHDEITKKLKSLRSESLIELKLGQNQNNSDVDGPKKDDEDAP